MVRSLNLRGHMNNNEKSQSYQSQIIELFELNEYEFKNTDKSGDGGADIILEGKTHIVIMQTKFGTSHQGPSSFKSECHKIEDTIDNSISNLELNSELGERKICYIYITSKNFAFKDEVVKTKNGKEYRQIGCSISKDKDNGEDLDLVKTIIHDMIRPSLLLKGHFLKAVDKDKESIYITQLFSNDFLSLRNDLYALYGIKNQSKEVLDKESAPYLEENPRFFDGLKNETNSNMFNTATISPNEFAGNNAAGVTLCCLKNSVIIDDEKNTFEIMPSAIPQITNGNQTLSVIINSEIYNNKKNQLIKPSAMLKLVFCDSYARMGAITRFNNKSTKVPTTAVHYELDHYKGLLLDLKKCWPHKTIATNNKKMINGGFSLQNMLSSLRSFVGSPENNGEPSFLDQDDKKHYSSINEIKIAFLLKENCNKYLRNGKKSLGSYKNSGDTVFCFTIGKLYSYLYPNLKPVEQLIDYVIKDLENEKCYLLDAANEIVNNWFDENNVNSLQNELAYKTKQNEGQSKPAHTLFKSPNFLSVGQYAGYYNLLSQRMSSLKPANNIKKKTLK